MARKVSPKIALKMKARGGDYYNARESCRNRELREKRALKKNKKKSARQYNKKLIQEELEYYLTITEVGDGYE